MADAEIAAIICAAGASTRMGGIKKEYCPLPGGDGLTVLGKTVLAFAAIPEIKNIVITVPANGSPSTEGATAAQKALAPSAMGKLVEGECRVHFIDGGVTRQASVFNALSMLATEKNIRAPDYVLIHDGARPWVSISLIQRIIAEVKKSRAVIPLLPLTETPKTTDTPLDNSSDGPVVITQHLRRAFVGGAQTPQGFAFPEILAAHQQAKDNAQIEYTDDAEIWGAFCGPVAAIPGEPENRKITFPEDIC
jgi:2-C-methyl-D-erythritol 4-phosphate cytidylyltransferase